MFELVGLSVHDYPYWNSKKNCIDASGLLGALEKADAGLDFLGHGFYLSVCGSSPKS